MKQTDDEKKGSFPPWSRVPSLEEMTREAGIDPVEFLQNIQAGCDNQKLADKFKVSPETIECLYNHFLHYGVGSIMGGD